MTYSQTIISLYRSSSSTEITVLIFRLLAWNSLGMCATSWHSATKCLRVYLASWMTLQKLWGVLSLSSPEQEKVLLHQRLSLYVHHCEVGANAHYLSHELRQNVGSCHSRVEAFWLPCFLISDTNMEYVHCFLVERAIFLFMKWILYVVWCIMAWLLEPCC